MLIGASRAHLRRPESPAPYVNTAASPTRQRARPKRPGSEPFVRVGGCAGPRHHERLGRGGGGVRRLGAARAGGGHDVVVPLAVSPVGGAGGRLVRHLWSVQLYHHPPSEHRGRRVDDHERLRPAAVRGALLLPVCGVCDRGGREGGPAALLAEGRLLLRDGRHPHRHEPHADHAAGQRHCLCHGGAVRTVRPGQEGRCHLLRPDPAAEAAGRRGEVGGDPRGGAVTATRTPSSPAWPGEEPLPDSRTWRLPLPPDQPAPRAPRTKQSCGTAACPAPLLLAGDGVPRPGHTSVHPSSGQRTAEPPSAPPRLPLCPPSLEHSLGSARTAGGRCPLPVPLQDTPVPHLRRALCPLLPQLGPWC